MIVQLFIRNANVNKTDCNSFIVSPFNYHYRYRYPQRRSRHYHHHHHHHQHDRCRPLSHSLVRSLFHNYHPQTIKESKKVTAIVSFVFKFAFFSL